MTSPYPVIHQHPLAYLLGLEGVALMRAFAGEHGQAFTEARLAEIRTLLERADLAELEGVDVAPMATSHGYDGWAARYDGEANTIFSMQDDVLMPLLDSLARGVVVDAACGTGRISRRLLDRGHRVLGVDSSPGMLARAREAVPDATFHEGDLASLPVNDASIDHVICTLALTHVAELDPFFAEAARVMRPGGHLVVSDTRGQFLGSSHYPLIERDVEGNRGYLPGWRHETGDYLRAGLRHGFVARACEESRRPEPTVEPEEIVEPLPADEPPDIWYLHPWVAEAANAARAGMVGVIVWDFERT